MTSISAVVALLIMASDIVHGFGIVCNRHDHLSSPSKVKSSSNLDSVAIQATNHRWKESIWMIKNDWSDEEEDSSDISKKNRSGWDTLLKDTLDGMDNSLDDDSNTRDFARNLDGLNPLKYDASKMASPLASAPKRVPGKSTRVSLRETQMQELNRQLLDAVGSPENRQAAMKSILQQYQNFLLEPLEDTDAVLDENSIYTSQMTRPERYQAFRISMNERIESSRNLKVKAVLEAMRDFVLEFE
jgi:hypothetical protein